VLLAGVVWERWVQALPLLFHGSFGSAIWLFFVVFSCFLVFFVVVLVRQIGTLAYFGVIWRCSVLFCAM
jgi:hypothetical protein